MTVRPVVVLGEPLVALVATSPGPLHAADAFRPHVVGAESNAGVGLARLGLPVAMVGRTGADAMGMLVLRALRGEGIDVGHLAVDESRPTGLLLRNPAVGGRGEVLYHRAGSAGSALSAADADRAGELIAGAAWLHLSGVTPALGPGPAAAVARAADLARAAGVPVSLDLNYRARLWSREAFAATLRPLVAGCRLVLAGREEARMLLDAGSEAGDEELASALVALGAAEAVVKLGEAGALLAGPGPCVHEAARRAAVVDEVGAGDAFAAGMIGGLLLGRDSAEAVRWGTVAAAFAIGAHGDVTGLPTRAELEAALGGSTDVVR